LIDERPLNKNGAMPKMIFEDFSKISEKQANKQLFLLAILQNLFEWLYSRYIKY